MKECHNTQTKQLINEIKERIENLKLLGLNEQDIINILMSNPIQLSPLLISKDYRIFLSEYNYLEIKMYPLTKTLFFFYLRHPEGIRFKQLADYKDELMNIYKKVSNRNNIEDMKKSIDAVTNPNKNRMNEISSKIKEVFLKHLDKSIAKNYFIMGKRATPKKIILDRFLIISEENFK